MKKTDMRVHDTAHHQQRPSPAQSRCLLILQGTRQRTFGTVLSWRELHTAHHHQRPSPAQSRCLLILQGTRQRTFGTVLSWRELRNTVCQDQIDHDTQASYQMDDERFPSQVAPNERLSQINEEDKRATGGSGGSLRAQRKRETQPEYAKEGSCSSPRDSCRE
ncbi:hypothetical protein L210DRAFT_2531251 [Boletus edulis BED1]|uniref:Uncharacterized protein n=1 Tax=Boletus edulis BED1 TaxID=1328754 RepID=A0AAD4BN07_BOLED|nr:hypothetical protein L210DRAFT_2531251 [Boletus edulis BED1]